jgi:hypothetical protein
MALSATERAFNLSIATALQTLCGENSSCDLKAASITARTHDGSLPIAARTFAGHLISSLLDCR